MSCSFIPPYLLEQIARRDSVVAERVAATLAVDARVRERQATYAGPTTAPATVSAAAATSAWTVHTADSTTTLPGRAVRAVGDPPSGDVAVDEAADGITGALGLFADVFGRSSYDGAGAPVSLTVHYGHEYDNAFWDGTQLVFGDGDGELFDRFTKPVDVLGHELTHAVTEHSAGLRYQGQSGALNESVSDVFGSCLKQWLLDQTVDQADWLVGAGLFLPGVNARGLRDMAAPGTAYDDPLLGKDPQGASMDDYVQTQDDNGGVHLNSGIPNRAFHLAATAIGGSSWSGAGAIWYAALTGDAVGPDTDFAGFAAATLAAAGEHADAVGQAWETVGVTPQTAGPTPSDGTASEDDTGGGQGAATRVWVRRTGGFAGRTSEGALDLEGDDERVPEVRSLVERIDLAQVAAGRPHPDMFVYDFDLCGRRAAHVPEQHLTPDLSRLAVLVLEGRPLVK